MGYRGQGAVLYRVERARPVRPVGITMIACFQLLKSAALLVAAGLLRYRPELDSDSAFYQVLYVATRGKFEKLSAALQGGDALAGLLLLLGIYLGAIGIGLWNLNAWSRRTTVFTCGMTVLLWLWSNFAAKTQESVAAASPDMTNFYVLLALDAAVFLYLVRGNTAECFEARA